MRIILALLTFLIVHISYAQVDPPLKNDTLPYSVPFSIEKKEINLDAHCSNVEQIVFSADNQLFYSLGADKCSKVWDLNSGKVLRTVFHEHMLTDAPHARITVSPDKKFVIAYDSLIEIWTPLLEQKLVSIKDDPGGIGNLVRVDVTKDGRKLIRTTLNNVVITDIETQKRIFGYYPDSLKGLQVYTVFGSAIVHDSLVYVHTNRGVDVINLNTYETYVLMELNEMSNGVIARTSFSTDGKYLAFFSLTAGTYGQFLYDLEFKRRLEFYNYNHYPSISDFTEDNKTFFLGTSRGLRKVAIDSNMVIQTDVEWELNFGTGLALNGSNTLLSACEPEYGQNNINIYSVPDLKRIKQIEAFPVNAVTFKIDQHGETLMGFYNRSDLLLYNLKDSTCIIADMLKFTIDQAVHEGKFLAVNGFVRNDDHSSSGSKLIVYELKDSLKEIFRIKLDYEYAQYTPYGLNSKNELIARAKNDTVFVYHLRTLQCIATIKSVDKYVAFVKFSLDGNYLMVNNSVYDLIKKQWKTVYSINDARWDEVSKAARNIVFSDDLRYLFTVCNDHSCFVHDLKKNKRILDIQLEATDLSYISDINAVFSKNNKFIGVAGNNLLVTVWDLKTKKTVAVQNGNWSDKLYEPQKFDRNKFQVMKYMNAFYFSKVK